MTDVAALIANARRYSEAPSTVDALATEIARLKAEKEPYFSKELHEEGVRALARVTHERDVWQSKAKYYGSEVGKANAELTRLVADNRLLKEEVERLLAYGLTVPHPTELSEAKAEIARLHDKYEELDVRFAKYIDEAKAEIARLREWKTAAEGLIEAIRIHSGVAYPWPALDLADEALKPDTGE